MQDEVESKTLTLIVSGTNGVQKDTKSQSQGGRPTLRRSCPGF